MYRGKPLQLHAEFFRFERLPVDADGPFDGRADYEPQESNIARSDGG